MEVLWSSAEAVGNIRNFPGNLRSIADGNAHICCRSGVLFGTAGIKVLASKDARKVYTQCTAAVLRAKECVMKTATAIQENAEVSMQN